MARYRHYWKGHFVRELPDELLDELLERIVALGRPPGGILIESLHGAPKDADAPTGAVGFRHAAFNVSALAIWQDPDLDAEQIDWARDTAAAVEPWSFGGGYVNYMQADEPIERVRAAFGAEAFDRLQVAKAAIRPAQRPAPQPEHPAARRGRSRVRLSRPLPRERLACSRRALHGLSAYGRMGA